MLPITQTLEHTDTVKMFDIYINFIHINNKQVYEIYSYKKYTTHVPNNTKKENQPMKNTGIIW